MRIFPIIPIWIMVIILLGLLIFILKDNKFNEKIREIVIIILLFVINLRIMIPSSDVDLLSNDLDVLFVIDNTISMNAEDYNGNDTRLIGVKEACNYIINELSGARFSIMTFSNEVKTITPYTNDINMTLESIEIMSVPERIRAKGTSLNIIKDAIINRLENQNNERKQLVFIISDGEITNEEELESFKKISDYVDGGSVLGYGTVKGGYMREIDKYDDEVTYIMDTSGLKYEKAISKIDENNLKKMADDIKIDYIKVNKINNIYNKVNDIKKMVNSKITNDNKSAYKDTYYYFVLLLMIVLILDFRKYKRGI